MAKTRILIIDDDDDFRETTKIILQGADYDVITASDGAQGLALAHGLKPNVILLDLMMPGEDGYSVCRQIKEDPTLSSIAVIIVTSISRDLGSDYLKKIAKNHQADEYLEKPLTKDKLLDTLSRISRAKSRIPRSSNKKRRVLIIDDDPDVLASLELVLQKDGYEVYVAESAIEGMKLAKAFHPDAIILDVMLPDKDGYTTCYELKKDRDTRDIPVLILTALPAELNKPGYAQNIAKDHLADAYAVKPITPNELLSKISSFTEKDGCSNRES